MISLAISLTAQQKNKNIVTEVINVKGNCGMCKKKIEEAVDVKGVKKAHWDETTKKLTLTYRADLISIDSLQHRIADAGYDTEKYKAKDEVYQKLHGCCQYER